MQQDKITIDGKEYHISPLRCGELKQIDKILKERTANGFVTAGFSDLDVWGPFMAKAIRREHNDFKEEQLDEMTLQEFLDGWNRLCELSGIKLQPKGESMPTVQTGPSFTEESQVASAGLTER